MTVSSESNRCSSAGPQSGSDGGSAAALNGGSAAAPTSLEHLETIEQGLTISVQSSAAHSRFRLERLAVLAAFADDPVNRFPRRAAKMADCCSTPAVGLTAAGAVGCVWFRCRDRLCPLCAHARSAQVADRIMTATRNADSLRFLTLTIKASEKPLKDQLDRLYDRYREFRRTQEWKRHVRGGIATVEVTRNETTGSWHAHLHVLIDGEFWHQRDIANAWERCTGDSRIVDIRAVRSRVKSARYLAKYASKPPKISHWPPAVIREYAAAIHRRRMVMATGSMHASKTDGDVEKENDRVQGDRIPLHAIERRSVYGCEKAAIVLAALASQSAAYQSSLAVRSPGTLPNLAAGRNGRLHSPSEAYGNLLELWVENPVGFVMDASLPCDYLKPSPKPPGVSRLKNHTEPLADWHRQDTRHV